MKNYVQPGESITLTAAAAASSGEGVLVNSLFGIASGDAATQGIHCPACWAVIVLAPRARRCAF